MRYAVKICCLLLVISLMGAFICTVPRLQAADEKNYVTQDDLQAVLEKLEQITRENRQLRSQVSSLNETIEGLQKAREASTYSELTERIKVLEAQKSGGGDVVALQQELEDLNEDVKFLSEDMEVVGRKALGDMVQITAEMRTRVDWFDFKETLPVKTLLGRRRYKSHNEEEVNGLISNRMRLNLFAKLKDNLQFSGRLVMYKNWNEDTLPQYPSLNFMNSERRPTDARLRVERAYVDYFFALHEKLPMALTFGRLPLTDGFPTDLRENTPRKSTYPGLAFDGQADGVGLTVGLHELIGLPDAALRMVYLRLVRHEKDTLYRKHAYDLEELDMYILQLETGLPGRLRDTMLVANFMYMPDVPTPDLSQARQWLSPLQTVNSMGSWWKFTFFVQSKRFLGSWVDWFAGYSYLKSDASGKASVWGVGPIPLSGVGLYNSDGKSDRSAFAYHLGVRINLPIAMLNNPKLGIEFNRGSKYWMGFNEAAEDPLNKLDVRGQVWDFYYIQPVTKHFTIRAGYTMVDVDHGGLWFYGARTNIDQEIRNTYILLDAKF
ncbi:DUF3373 family protein [Thermodesulfobacteriota bacterium]